MIKPTYFGPGVRINPRKTDREDCLIVQWYSDLAGDWIEAKRFALADEFCYSLARDFAAELAHHLRQLERARSITMAAEDAASIGRFENSQLNS